MAITAYAREDENDEPVYTKLTLEDGSDWTDTVLDSLENANWHEALEAFEPLFKLLPEVYDALQVCGFHGLAQRLEKSTDKWDQYF